MVIVALAYAVASTSLYALVEVHGKSFVIAYEDEPNSSIQLPLPRAIRAQMPTGFQLKVQPTDALMSKSVLEGPTGDTILELKFKALKKDKKINIEWRCQVVVDMMESFYAVPPSVPFPQEFPEEARPWLRASLFVQSDDKRIRDKALTFRGNDVIDTINKTMSGMSTILGQQKSQMAADCSAVATLTNTGSCTNNANLLAALLRANGIPTRILSGFPTWAGSPYQTHYIVEAYVPTVGWYPLEPTLLAKGWTCLGMPIASVVSVENEGLGVRRLQGAAGVPFLSLTEAFGKIIDRGSLTKTFCDHEAKTLGAVTEKDWIEAKTKWSNWREAAKVDAADLAPPKFVRGI
ncbi:MAG: transglutaminase domain-containing protein [Fimbriimonadaceae bacterium]